MAPKEFSFDISAKNNIGTCEMLMFALKIITYS